MKHEHLIAYMGMILAVVLLIGFISGSFGDCTKTTIVIVATPTATP